MQNQDSENLVISAVLKALGYSEKLLAQHKQELKSLIADLNENIITSDDVSEQLERMTKREKILNRQKAFCGIWLATDGRLKTFAGHKDISTTQKCYIHQVKDITEYAEEFAKVLDS